MATEKICDVCSVAGAEKVSIAINTISNSGSPVGTSQACDLCPVHRIEKVPIMYAQCVTDIEAAIAG
jgi:hypothetical protein